MYVANQEASNDVVSIVIPTRDRWQTFKKTIESYFVQKFLKEIIIVDDASSEPVPDCFLTWEEEGKVKILRNKTRKGAAACRLYGVKEAKGKYILFGEDDAYLDSEYVSILLHKLSSTPELAIVSGRIVYMLPSETINDACKRFGEGILDDVIFDQRRFAIRVNAQFKGDCYVPFTHALYLVNKSTVLSLGFDTFYCKGNGFREETDTQLAALAKGYKIVITNDTRCFHLSKKDVAWGGQRVNRFYQFFWSVYYTAYMLKKYDKVIKSKLSLNRGYVIAIVVYTYLSFSDIFLMPIIRRLFFKRKK